jgi:Protein of unknown function (DUF2911)
MKIHKTYIAIGLIIAFALLFEIAAHATEADQSTEITFNRPIQVPGQVLPAGTYLLKLLNTDDLDTVQIFSSDRTGLYATLGTVPAASREPVDDTTVTLVEQGTGKPDILLKWFYPGEETGHRFAYSKQLERQIAQDRQQTIVANPQPTTGSEAGGSN